MYAACFLAFCTGFLSLSLEILWIRLFSFANHSMPQAFAFVLAVYLIGIAFGAHLGKWFCKRHTHLWLICGVTLVFSSICDLVGPWIYSSYALTHFQLLIGGIAILMTASLKAIAFPIAHHLGAPTFSVDIGRKISRVYVSNIMGATIGPLFTGIVLLALLTTQQSFIVCAMLTLGVAIFCLLDLVPTYALAVGAAFLIGQAALLVKLNPHSLIIRVANPVYGNIIHTIENQYGIITAYAGGRDGDVVAGGNLYDGRTNLNPVINSNRINRVIVLAALVDEPRRILMIGLSVGSWLKIAETFPAVEQIDVLEINPGYLDLIQHYPSHVTALLDPRVNLHIDDGRRWLKTHPNERYDLIIMNTTYHWRAYTGNLLSQEFLRLLKKHMNEAGVLEYNSTGSPDVLKTADSVFKHAYMYENFVIAANFDWREKLRSQAAVEKLAALQMDGYPLYPPGSEPLIAGYLNLPVSNLDSIEPIYNGMGRQLEIITDNNVITEYKYGKSL